MSKEAWMAAHEQLVEEYLDAHPNVTWTQAYLLTADGASDRARENMADQIDHARMLAKEDK